MDVKYLYGREYTISRHQNTKAMMAASSPGTSLQAYEIKPGIIPEQFKTCLVFI